MDEETKLPENISEGEIKEIENREVKNEKSKLFLFSYFKEWKAKNKKTDFYVEIVLFFILGILIGIAIKNEAFKRITIGFDDYKMKIQRQDYNLNKIEKDLIEKQMQEAQQNQQNSAEQEQNSGATENTNQ